MPHLTAILLESQLLAPLRQAAGAAGISLDLLLLHSFDDDLRRALKRSDALFGGVLNLDAEVRRLAAAVAECGPPVRLFFHSQVEALQMTRIGDFDAGGAGWREVLPILREAGAPLPDRRGRPD